MGVGFVTISWLHEGDLQEQIQSMKSFIMMLDGCGGGGAAAAAAEFCN